MPVWLSRWGLPKIGISCQWASSTTASLIWCVTCRETVTRMVWSWSTFFVRFAEFDIWTEKFSWNKICSWVRGSWKIWCEVRDTFPVGWNASEVHGAVDAGKWLQECKAVCSGYYVNHSPKCCWEYQDIKMVGPTMLMPEIRQIIMVTWCLIWNSKIALNFWGHFPVPKSTRTCHLKWWDLEGPMIFCPSELPKSQPLIGQVPAFSSEGLWLLGQQKVTDHLLVPGTNFFSVWLSWFWVGHQPRSGLFKGITANYARFGPCARLLAYLLIYLVFGRWWNI